MFDYCGHCPAMPRVTTRGSILLAWAASVGRFPLLSNTQGRQMGMWRTLRIKYPRITGEEAFNPSASYSGLTADPRSLRFNSISLLCFPASKSVVKICKNMSHNCYSLCSTDLLPTHFHSGIRNIGLLSSQAPMKGPRSSQPGL